MLLRSDSGKRTVGPDSIDPGHACRSVDRARVDDAVTENPAIGETEIWKIYRLDGNITPPTPWETGFKDTVIAYPGQVERAGSRRARPKEKERLAGHASIPLAPVPDKSAN
jgi:hypothetical protein